MNVQLCILYPLILFQGFDAIHSSKMFAEMVRRNSSVYLKDNDTLPAAFIANEPIKLNVSVEVRTCTTANEKPNCKPSNASSLHCSCWTSGHGKKMVCMHFGHFQYYS